MGKKWNRSKCNSYLEKAFRSAAKIRVTDAGSKNLLDDMYRRFLEGPYKDRRKRALANYCDRVIKEFPKEAIKDSQGKYTDVYEGFVYTQLLPHGNYNLLDFCGALRIGAAMWILEKLTLNGKLKEALPYLPDPDEVLQGDHFFSVAHALFPSSMVEAMALAISFRYLKPEGEVTNWHLSSCVIPEEMVNGRPLRDEYRKILELLPQEDIRKACNYFKQKVWEVTGLSLKSQKYMAERIAKHIRESMFAIDGLDESLARTTHRLRLPCAPVSKIQGLEDVIPKSSSPLNMFSGMFSAGTDATVLDGLRIIKEGEELKDKFGGFIAELDTKLSADKEELAKTDINEELANLFSGFKAKSLYDLCFALFYLVDAGDDAPWLMYSGGMLMGYVYRNLPWYNEESDGQEMKRLFAEEPDEVKERAQNRDRQEEIKGSLDYYSKKIGGLNLAQILFRVSHVVIPRGYPGMLADVKYFTGGHADEWTEKHLSALAGVMNMRSYIGEMFSFRELQASQERDGTDAAPVEEDSGKIKELEGSVARLTEEKAKLEEENKKLRDTAEWMRRNVDRTVTEFEKALEDGEKHRRELADLRELVFNSENGVQDLPEEKALLDGKEVGYPYKLGKRMVIFGGHDGWLKVMRQRFPDARFMDEKNIAFNPDVIKNSDIVWVQNNSICHPQFWNVAKYVGIYNKQMRYFTSAGTERCSKQLMEADVAC